MSSSGGMGITKTSTADFNQWLHAMRMVVRLPGEVPPEFRKKLWLSLAERYLHIKRVDWEKEASQLCFSEKWKTDDEELADQIVKDLHRTGSSFCSGSVNQAKLKRVLVGYARWNKEVGYCQGFNMLGALILQVMDTDEAAAIKIMIYLIEGVLPPGYFSGALTGLQADMGVFRELLSTRLPRLSKHLQKLQGLTNEGLEPPLINVFTMQWFLTLFCTCLPIKSVLRIWDLILTDGGDILLRTALALWELLESRILATRSADDFYCKMGVLSGDMLNGTLIEPNELVQRVVAMGPIHGLHKLRDKHLHNIAQWKDKRKLRLFYSDDDAESDEDSKVAVATIWGLRLNRRGSTASTNSNHSTTSSSSSRPTTASTTDREKIALDINLLKQQYGKLRQRQKQAQIILTAACARQSSNAASSFGMATASASSSVAAAASSSPAVTLNNLLLGRSAITSNKGRRAGAPLGAIPPARNTTGKSKSVIKPNKLPPETLHWKDTNEGATKKQKRRNSLKWKDIPRVDKLGDKQVNDIECVDQEDASTAAAVTTATTVDVPRRRMRSRSRSESSSYSEDSDGNSSTSTSLCDDENLNVVRDSGSSLESSPFKKSAEKSPEFEVPIADKIIDIQNYIDSLDTERIELEGSCSGSEKVDTVVADVTSEVRVEIEGDEDGITSTSQLSPVADLSQYLNVSSISPLKTPSSPFDLSEMLTATLSPSPDNHEMMSLLNDLEISEDGVTNTYFERMNSTERPSNMELTDSEEGRTLEHNSTLSIPTYEIIDADEIDQDLKLERSTSLNVLQSMNAPLKSATQQDIVNVEVNCGAKVKDKSLKGKSSSLEETKRPMLKKSYPVSCSEGLEVKRSEKALEIIQENSKILHRILKKNNNGGGTTTTEDASASASMVIESTTMDEKNKMEKSFPFSLSTSLEEQETATSQQVRNNTPTAAAAAAASISDTLSSIEHTIKSINSLCQERETFGGKTNRSRLMESIEEIINSGNAIKVQIDSSDDINRKLNPSRSQSVSPLNARISNGRSGGEIDSMEVAKSVSTDRCASPEYRPWSRSPKEYPICTHSDSFNKLDKSPSSPVITRDYLDSLKPTPSDRVTKSAENSPSRSLSRDTQDYGQLLADDSFMRQETRDFLESFSIMNTSTNGPSTTTTKTPTTMDKLFEYGIESRRKHKSLEFDAI